MNEIMGKFTPCLELSEAFCHEVVEPILDRRFPGLIYSAGKLHRGSDVLSFDTPQSTDHDWGPSKIDLFLREDECDRFSEDITDVLADELPPAFRGLPTGFVTPESDGGSIWFADEHPTTHRISVTTVDRFFRQYIGLNPLDGMSTVKWLTIAPQSLRTITSGKVFHDGLDQLEEAQRRLRWYPKDVWLYLLSCQWRKIDQEEPFMARCGDVGDELGSRVVATRMVNEVMRLCFLMERQYWPYYKWFGSAFAELECAVKLIPIFHSVLDSQGWREREAHLSSAYVYIANMHNKLNVTEHIEPGMRQFHDRPYQVLQSERFVDALYSSISPDAMLALPRHLGGIAQYVDSTDVLDRVGRCGQLALLYDRNVEQPASGDPDKPGA